MIAAVIDDTMWEDDLLSHTPALSVFVWQWRSALRYGGKPWTKASPTPARTEAVAASSITARAHPVGF